MVAGLEQTPERGDALAQMMSQYARRVLATG
jgi:hypothetical protein